jgi:hypothetical protein
MAIVDRLLTLKTVQELTETAWWTDTIFRGLEEFASGENAGSADAPAPPTESVNGSAGAC